MCASQWGRRYWPLKINKGSRAYHSRIVREEIPYNECIGMRIFISELNHNGPFGSAIMREIITEQLYLAPHSVEVNRAFYEDVLTSRVDGLRLRSRLLWIQVHQLLNWVAILKELAVSYDDWQICFVKEEGACSDIMLILRILEIKA